MEWIHCYFELPKESGTYEITDAYNRTYIAEYNSTWGNWNYFEVIKWRELTA